jgi:membrane protease YdiL (CAAX protease family)
LDTHKKGIIVYLLIAFGLAWFLWEIPLRIGLSPDNPLFQLAILPGAFAPAVGAVVVRKWVTQEGFRDAGLRINLRQWRYYIAGWSLPLVVVAVITLLAAFLAITYPDFTLERALRELIPDGTPLPSIPPGIFVLLPLQFMIVALVATPILWGEEFGWRGYLQIRLMSNRPLLAAISTGLIWGLWHLPINLRGYNFPGNPLLGMLVFMVSAVMLSIIFGWLRVRTGSIWSASLAHSATNAVGGSLTLLLFMGGPNWIFVSYVGVLAWVPLGIICAWIVATGQLTESSGIPDSNAP